MKHQLVDITQPTEWWHFYFEGWQNDQKFPPLDISLEDLYLNEFKSWRTSGFKAPKIDCHKGG